MEHANRAEFDACFDLHHEIADVFHVTHPFDPYQIGPGTLPGFGPDTLIATPRGEIPVQSLQRGDRVITRDSGLQPVRWVGRSEMARQKRSLSTSALPVMIRAGALGQGRPARDLIVSPHHRVLITDAQLQLCFDQSEVLVMAGDLVGRAGITAIDQLGVGYVQIMCDRHEILLANGMWSESFLPTHESLRAMDAAQKADITTLFPTLACQTGYAGFTAARRLISSAELSLMAV